jgi:hypothetical protein
MDPVAFHARVLAHADAEGRLPRQPEIPTAEIFPYESGDLRPIRIDPLVLPEPPRHGEDAASCGCGAGIPAKACWADEDWYLRPLPDHGLPGVMLNTRAHLDLEDLDDRLAADLGVLTVRITRALMNLGGIGRVHVYRWGDGGAHFHLWFFARPAGFLQLRGSSLADWSELLPPLPAEELTAMRSAVARELATWRGTAR